jgi:hypothetical protein
VGKKVAFSKANEGRELHKEFSDNKDAPDNKTIPQPICMQNKNCLGKTLTVKEKQEVLEVFSESCLVP